MMFSLSKKDRLAFQLAIVVLATAFAGHARAQVGAAESSTDGGLPGALEQRDETSPGGSGGDDAAEGLSAVRGVNYIPSYAASSKEIWLGFDPETIGRELDKAAEIGFNAVRVQLNFNAWEERPSSITEGFPAFLELCRERGLRVMPVLFDSWGVDERDNRPKPETARMAYQRFLSRSDVYALHDNYEKFMKPLAEEIMPDVEVPTSNDPGVIFWREWSPTPGHARMSADYHGACKEYVMEVVAPFLDDDVIVAWDVMNQPSTIRSFARRPDPIEAFEFTDAMVMHLKALQPTQPVTVGVATGRGGTGRFELRLDLVSVQSLEGDRSELRRDVLLAERSARGRPLMLTIAGADFFPIGLKETTEEYQARVVREAVRVANRDRLGYFLWHLVQGEALTPWAGLLREDGTPTAAALWLKEQFGQRRHLSAVAP